MLDLTDVTVLAAIFTAQPYERYVNSLFRLTIAFSGWQQ